MGNGFAVVSPQQPGVRLFATGGAVKVTAFGLMAGDCVSFKAVEEKSVNPGFRRSGCSVSVPSENEIALAVEYRVGDCLPTLHSGRPTLYINRPGKYLPVVSGSASDALLVKVEPVTEREFSAAEMGIVPCGCPCAASSWSWSGAQRFNGDMLEREYISNCGDREWRVERAVYWWETGVERCSENRLLVQEQSEAGLMRWRDSGRVCGFSPSVPVLVEDKCGGCASLLGFMFHPDEPRDPAANVAVRDCSDGVYGYVYPTAGAGHTVPLGGCDGAVTGWLANRSDSAPALWDCQKPPVVNVPEPRLPRSVTGLEWRGDALRVRFSDGGVQDLDAPVC